jgi:uncharacterized protein YbjT (DUF2867 family)
LYTFIAMGRDVFITGGTGYIGRPFIEELRRRGHRVRALVRPGSEGKLPAGVEAVVGDALDGRSYADRVKGAEAFVQLVGVPHPGPQKAAQFRSVDLVAGREAVAAARDAGVTHFIYLSVAQPAPVMKAFIAVRAEVEDILARSGLPATVLRPWYVLGPGHRWPLPLVPVFWALAKFPPTGAGARRLGFVTLGQVVKALCRAVEEPPAASRVWDVPALRRVSAS